MDTRVQRTVVVVVAVALFVGGSGCSVYMAAKQPDQKNLSILGYGTARGVVLAEFGEPAQTAIVDGVRSDFFYFTQGYTTGVKTSRAVFHAVADVFTIGLWEIVGTPTEAIFDGTEMQVRITYNADDTIRSAEVFDSEHASSHTYDSSADQQTGNLGMTAGDANGSNARGS